MNVRLLIGLTILATNAVILARVGLETWLHWQRGRAAAARQPQPSSYHGAP